jgi:hypothetical protein
MTERNLRYDEVVHAMEDRLPLCGEAMIPACAPEVTSEPATCMWCLSLIS